MLRRRKCSFFFLIYTIRAPAPRSSSPPRCPEEEQGWGLMVLSNIRRNPGSPWGAQPNKGRLLLWLTKLLCFWGVRVKGRGELGPQTDVVQVSSNAGSGLGINGTESGICCPTQHPGSGTGASPAVAVREGRFGWAIAELSRVREDLVPPPGAFLLPKGFGATDSSASPRAAPLPAGTCLQSGLPVPTPAGSSPRRRADDPSQAAVGHQ